MLKVLEYNLFSYTVNIVAQQLISFLNSYANALKGKLETVLWVIEQICLCKVE